MPRRRVSPAAGFGLRDEIVAQRRACTFDADRHEYRVDGELYPSVTQVLNEERLIDFSRVPPSILEEARARGTYVHTVLHYYLEGDYDLDDCDPRFRGYVDSGVRYLEEIGKRPVVSRLGGMPLSLEFRFWHSGRKFAGTADFVGLDRDGILAVDDWKTGTPAEVAAPLQLAAYELGIREYLCPLIGYTGEIRRRAVKLFKDGTTGRPEPYRDPRDLAMFLNALSLVHFRRNNLRHE